MNKHILHLHFVHTLWHFECSNVFHFWQVQSRISIFWDSPLCMRCLIKMHVKLQ